MKIKIKNYKIIWQGQLKGKDRTLFVINPETDDVRLAVWGKSFPYAIGEEIEGEIRTKETNKDGKIYVNKYFVPGGTRAQKVSTRITFQKISQDLEAVKELLERNLKLLEGTKEELNQLAKVIYETEFEKQIENYQSQREDDADRVSEQDDT